ncbi:hypothetical protein [Chitinimonas sp.]|uniref:hypothetical protein n=1 Tax=Chitinimonas sp. TaxID=1934313 RepID=UPI0035B2CAF2
MSALKKWLFVLAGLIAVLAVLPLVLPYDRVLPDVEKAMTARLDIAAHVGNIGFSYSPKPQLVLEQVTLGKDGEASIGKVIIPISLSNLLQFRHSLSNVVLDSVQLKQEFAISLPGRLKPNPDGRDIRFASLRLENVNVSMKNGAIGPLSAVVTLNTDGTFKDVTISDKDGRAELNIKPKADKFALEFSAKNWVLPGNYEARFDQVTMRGMAGPEGIAIDYVNGFIFGAAAVGQAQLDWQNGWKLTGTLETKGMQVEPLIMLASANTRSTGRMAANVRFEYAGDGYETLFKQPRIEMQFLISDGNLHNFDLVTPLKSQSPSITQRGGQTRFETFSGLAILDGSALALSKLQLNGGKFSASGNLNVDDKQGLSGHINARLSAGALVVNAPLTIAGKLDAPEIRSGGAYKPGGDNGTTRIF